MTVPRALEGKPPVNAAVSGTVAPTGTWVTGLLLESLMTVAMPGVKNTAEVDRARSCEPVLAPSRLVSAMWKGEPLMKLAELPKPQSSWLAMWPPHASTTVQPPGGAAVA